MTHAGTARGKCVRGTVRRTTSGQPSKARVHVLVRVLHETSWSILLVKNLFRGTVVPIADRTNYTQVTRGSERSLPRIWHNVQQ